MKGSKKRPIRILSIGHSHIIAVNRSVFRELANDPEFAVTIAAPNKFKGDLRPLSLEPEPAESKLKLIGIDAVRTGSIHLFNYDQGQLDELMQEQKYDVVHIWAEPFSMSCFQVMNACRQDTKVCFYTFQNINKEYPFPLDEIERDVVRRATRWIGAGKLIYQTMLERNYHINTGCIIPLAVDTSVFRPNSPAKNSDLIKKLKLKQPVIGFLGRLTEEKGIDVLLSALDLIDPSLDWSVLFIGSGEYRAGILNWARERGRASRVKVKLLAHSEVPNYLAAMHVLVAPSQTRKHWKEQFGRMLIEAFACGVPVIGSDSAEIPYVVGDAGQIISETDVKGWASAIELLLIDESLRLEYIRKGFMRGESFSSKAVARQLGDLFKEMMSEA